MTMNPQLSHGASRQWSLRWVLLIVLIGMTWSGCSDGLLPPTGSPGGQLPIGALCSTDEDCASGRCLLLVCTDQLLPPSGILDGGLEIGAECVRDEDCTSGRCSLLVCKEKAAGGEGCLTDKDCESGTCSGFVCTEPPGSPESPGGTAGDCVGDCFPNLVAAGDVDQSSVVLWARASFTGTVQFEYGRDPDFIETDGVRDVVVMNPDIPAKVPDIDGLLAGTQYYYRACRGSCSATIAAHDESRGSFRTPHADGHHGLRFGATSCFKEAFRPFVAIGNVPNRDLDFFVALGDNVYADRAGTVDAFRNNYKKSYNQVDSQEDNMFARARASTAFFVTIDDHEVRNDFAGGAKPRPDEPCPVVCSDVCDSSVECCETGDENCSREFYNETDVFMNGLRAFFEYNPIRPERYGEDEIRRMRGKNKLYRYRTFGSDAALFVLDARSFRDEPIPLGSGVIQPLAFDNRRSMLGTGQRKDLLNDLQAAQNDGIVWKFILIPEPIQNVGPLPPPRDRFAGFAHERGVLLHYIERKCIDNVVFISGDIHMNLVNNIAYQQSVVDLQRYSAAWDISTGPVGHESPGSAPLQHPAYSIGLFDTLLGLGYPVPGPDALLEFRPATGLPYIELQRWNMVPAVLVESVRPIYPWSSADMFSWSEFQIDGTTLDLQVTTYGIDHYEPGASIEEILSREHVILNRFIVEPRSAEDRQTCVVNNMPLPALAPCFSDIECASGTCLQECPQGQCLPGLCCLPSLCSQECGDGVCEGTESCGNENITSLTPSLDFHECRDDCGRCENGSFCLEHADCQSGICNLGICVGQGQLPAGVPCNSDDACISGNCTGVCIQECGDGSCDGTEKCGDGHSLVECQDDCGLCPNGSVCLENGDCQGGQCTLGICVDCITACEAPCNATHHACVSGCEAGPVCGPVCQTCKSGCTQARNACYDACEVACN